ncbi:MAG: DUF3054 domain-containing protein [Nocardioides sp.]|nr:DUF3054 domain-containing protein [Nocardioides sp.]
MSRRTTLALVADALLIIIFASIGRAEHERGNAVVGALSTAWPFLVGAGIGWLLVTRLGRRLPVEMGPGITVWFCTVFLGMVLRRIAGDGTAFSFVIVASIVLAIFLLGWRAGYAWWVRPRR